MLTTFLLLLILLILLTGLWCLFKCLGIIEDRLIGLQRRNERKPL